MPEDAQNQERGETHVKIGEVAAQTGTTLRMLHYYEELGLIAPAKRTKGGFRLYRPDAVEAVRYIQYLRNLGLELNQVRSLFEARNSEDREPVSCMRSTVERELRGLKSTIFRYRKLQTELEATLDVLCECAARQCPKRPGGASCPLCEVILDREDVPITFLAAVSQ